jgi:hypothetical protein
MLAAILVGLMSFSIYAATGSAYASASSASASVRSTIKGHVEVYATIANALDSVRDEYDKNSSTYGSASVSASSLNVNGGAVQSARARGWFNDLSVKEAYWSAND